MTGQIGPLTGMPIIGDKNTADVASSAVTVSAASVWKTPQVLQIRCKIQNPEAAPEQKSSSSSQPTSPMLAGLRPDLSVACQALLSPEELLHGDPAAAEKVNGGGVPVYVMMPLDSVTAGNTMSRKKAMNVSLQALKLS